MKYLKYGALILVIISSIIYGISDYYIENKLTDELSKIINKDSLNYYSFSLENIDLSLATGSLILKGVKITPKNFAHYSLNKPNNQVRVLIHATCEEIELNELEIKHFLRTRELIIKEVNFTKPIITYLFNSHKKNNKNTLVLKNLFSSNFKKAEIKKLNLKEGKIRIKNIEDSLDLVNLNNYNFTLTNAYLDTATIKQFSPFKYENIKFWSDSVALNVSKDFEITTGKMQFNAQKKSTIIQHFKLRPFYKQGAFSAKYNVQKQWVAITLDTFEIIDVQFEDLLEHGNFVLNKVLLKNANIGLYKDKTKPEPPYKKQLLPASALRNLPVDLTIDTVLVENSRITINEKGKREKGVSELRFEKLNAQIYGFTNDSIKLIENNFLTINASSMIMGAASVNFHASFDLLSPIDEHTVTASVGSCNAKIFNKVLTPMMLVTIKSGKIIKLDYKYKGNDNEAIGSLNFEYENIKIDVLNKTQQDKKQGVLSLAANTLIRSSNKRSGGKTFVTGAIKTKRIQNKNIFPYLWHAVQSGIIYTMAPAFSETKKEEKGNAKKNRLKKKK